jgi:beta-lactamase regulating signal transducer with metallopeptidase domain
MLDALLAWLLTYLVHSTLLLAAAWAADRAGWLRRPRLAEIVWRIALFGGVLTATLQGPVRTVLGALPSATLIAPATAAQGAPSGLAAPSAREPIAAHTASSTDEAGRTVAAGWPLIGLPDLAQKLRQPDEALAQNRLLVPIAQAAPGIVIPWLLLVAIAIARTARAVRRLHREAAACPRVDDAATLRFVQSLSPCSAAPPLCLSRHWSSPLVTPNGAICLPHWVFSDLDPPQREAVLAHEMAHVQRRDPLWRLAAHVVARVGWLQPLNRVALRRLDAAAELMCDHWAAARADRGQQLAQALYLCAQRLAGGAAPALAMAMARGPSPLLARIEALLQERPMALPRGWRFALPALIGLAFGGFLALPAIGLSANTAHLSLRDHEQGLNVRIDGDITFSDDETDVRQLSDQATLEQTLQGHTRRIQFQHEGMAGVTRQYKLDGQVRPLDADARAWLARLIPQVLRATGWHARERLARIRARGGVAAAIDEIERAPAGFARSTYLETFAEMGPVDAAALSRLLAVTKTVDGDFERSQAYLALLRRQQFDAGQLSSLLNDLGSIDGDFEKQQVLERAATRLAPLLEASPGLAEAYVQAARPIRGAFERSNALVALIDTGHLGRSGYAAVLQAVPDMGSGIEACNVLVAVASAMPADADLIRQYRRAARGLDDVERGQAEKALDRLDS